MKERNGVNLPQLTDRQVSELEYHRAHAKENERVLNEAFSYEVLHEPHRRWWNAYWAMYDFLIRSGLKNKRVLVVGCGFGEDAIRIAKLGAAVSAFDLSPESIEIARRLARQEAMEIQFDVMAAERLSYPEATFDVIVVRDILHHVEVVQAMREIVRVAKPGAMLVVNEVYSHGATEKIRRSALVEQVIYPRLRAFVYGTKKPYITEQERKLNDDELAAVEQCFERVTYRRYFFLIVKRLLPEQGDAICGADYLILRALGPLGRFLSGRVLLAGTARRTSIPPIEHRGER